MEIDWIDVVLAILMSIPIAATLFLGAILILNGRHAMGRPTINPVFFYSGKFLLFIMWGIFWIIILFPSFRHFIPWMIQQHITDSQKLISALFLIPANLLIIPSYFEMGKITYLGLPTGKHSLRTHGIYKITRNPMYFSFLFLNIATFLVLPSLLLLLIMIYGMIVHHFIILSEERYLQHEFGEDYRSYKSRVPRYI